MPYTNPSRSNYPHRPTYNDWKGHANPYNDRPINPSNNRPYTNPKPASAKPSNPYDDPNRIHRRDQRRKDFANRFDDHRSSDHSKSFGNNDTHVDNAPMDTYMGDDSPSYDQNMRGPRTPDFSKDPLGLADGIPSKVEDRFSSRPLEARKPDPRFSTGEEMSASLRAMTSSGTGNRELVEAQRLALQALARPPETTPSSRPMHSSQPVQSSQSAHLIPNVAKDPFMARNSGSFTAEVTVGQPFMEDANKMVDNRTMQHPQISQPMNSGEFFMPAPASRSKGKMT